MSAAFSVKFSTAGTRHVTVTDTSSSITGTSGSVNVTQSTTHLSATAAATATAGTSFVVTVKALDGGGNVVTGYTGTVKLTSNDSAAVLPANSTLSSGQHAFTVTLKTAGAHTVTATDTANSGISGTTAAITVAPAATTHLLVTAPTSSAVGLSFLVAVTAKDAYQNTVTTYGGTVHLTSTDPSASLSSNAKLTNGVGNFSATLRTLGSRTVKATDTVTSSITGTSGTITVVARTSPVRAAGSDRIGTAVAVSQLNFPGGGAGAVVLARSDDFPDALVAAPLAAATRAPLLFVQGASLPTVTRDEISRVTGARGTVYLIGSTSAIPTSVETTLQSLGYSTVRLGGSDRYATAVAVANALGGRSTVFLATGINFPDALSAGPAAAHMCWRRAAHRRHVDAVDHPLVSERARQARSTPSVAPPPSQTALRLASSAPTACRPPRQWPRPSSRRPSASGLPVGRHSPMPCRAVPTSPAWEVRSC